MLRGWGRFLDGAADRARPDYVRALALYRDAGDRVGEAEVRDRRGSALRALGRLEEARRSFEQSLALARAAGQRDGSRATLSNLGNLALAAGDPERARRLHAEALTVARELGDPFGEMAARLGDARALRRLGRLDEARAQLEAAIATLETARGELARADHRRAFLAVFHHPYEELIDLLAGRALDEPGGGWAEQAFAAAERARARNLFESLAAAGGPEGGGAVAGGGAASGGGGSPGLPAPAEPAPVLSAAEVAERVLDPGTVLLSYSLGDERSWVFVATGGDPAGLEVRPLAGRGRIDAQAAEVARLLAASRDPNAAAQARLAAAALAREVRRRVR
jgi:tetratricopeptide (TPR) repeat protein